MGPPRPMQISVLKEIHSHLVLLFRFAPLVTHSTFPRSPKHIQLGQSGSSSYLGAPHEISHNINNAAKYQNHISHRRRVRAHYYYGRYYSQEK